MSHFFKWILLPCLILFPLLSSAQTIINRYAEVISRGNCSNTFNVDTALGFGVGDTVLMIQMKGAVVDSANTSAFGNVVAYNSAGNYEFNVIKSVSGNNITLKYKVLRSYDIPRGRVQFVRVANYINYTINTPHTCMPWNGIKGGVFIISVSGTLTVNSTIDVSGRGFLGGRLNGGLTYNCDMPDYYYPLSGNNGAMKGEGLAEVSLSKMYGKGKLANGGGGGNNTNAGGAGGGNVGAGGGGGHQWSYGTCDTSLPSGGIGGIALSYSAANNKLYLGGGGGAGHENNGNTDLAGNGGGIIIINVATFAGSSPAIKANGGSCININATIPNAGGDGQSAGGAGGTVLLKVSTFSTTPTIEAKGGDGGSVYALAVHGPGGGGGGGAVLFAGSSVSSTYIQTAGGTNGLLVNLGARAYDAQPGSAGSTVTGFPYILPIDTFKANQLIVNFTDSFVSCFSRKLIAAATAGAASYSWTASSAGTSTAINPSFTFPSYGSYPVKLIITDSNGCKDSMIKNIIIPYVHFANAGADSTTCLGVLTTLHASGGRSYAWSPAAGLASPNTASTTAAPAATTAYVVTETDSVGCTDRDTVLVTLVTGANVIASPHIISECKGKTIQLSATGTVTYQWSPASGLSNTGIANPIATINGNTTYVVTGKDQKGCISFDSVRIIQSEGPTVNAYAEGNVIVSCYAKSIQLHATGAMQYTWRPGNYLNDSTSASPTALPPHTTLFTVTGTDANGCAGTDTVTIVSYAEAVVYMPDAFTPNGDHLNDRIKPTIFCNFTLAKWEVYNRWGQNVFIGYDLNSGWDGSFHGVPAPIGVYMYYVKGTNDKGEDVLYKGDITLVR